MKIRKKTTTKKVQRGESRCRPMSEGAVIFTFLVSIIFSREDVLQVGSSGSWYAHHRFRQAALVHFLRQVLGKDLISIVLDFGCRHVQIASRMQADWVAVRGAVLEEKDLIRLGAPLYFGF